MISPAATHNALRRTQYDVVVIGGGWGGISAAKKAALLGKHVLLIEKNKLGGLCLHSGCIPSKALLWIAKGFDHGQHLEELGILKSPQELSWKAIQSYVNATIQALSEELAPLLKLPRLEMAVGSQAKFLGAQEIQVSSDKGSENTHFDQAIIACGSGVLVPEVFKSHQEQILTSSSIFTIPDWPQHLLIVGAGAIGCEFASFFARCKRTRVTLVEIKDQILPGEDPWIAQGLEQALIKQGAGIKKSLEVKELQKEAHWKVLLSSGERLECDQILLAAGRALKASHLGLENLPDIKASAKAIAVDAKLQTTIPHIYAIGDANGLSLFAHAASSQGEIAAINASGGNTEFNPLFVPRCLYSDPEAASVGFFPNDLEQKGISFKALRGSFSSNARGVCEGQKIGNHTTRIQILIEKSSKKILGAQLLGPMASELIHLFALAVTNQLAAEDLKKTIFAHPSYAESLGLTLQKVSRQFKNFIFLL